ncbi:MAG: hypothetical protein AAF993_15540 [Pseudomonadota bacterium]
MKKQTITLAKQILWQLSPGMFSRLVRDQHPQTFSIGIYTGNSPLTLSQPHNISNPVLTAADVWDVPAGFVADPFMLTKNDRWFMFFEVFNKVLRRGCIGVASSEDCQRWQYMGTAVKESFHMAYPQVLQHDGEVLMIPDTPGQGVRLYRAVDFPLRWDFVETIVADTTIVDPTLTFYNDQWWLFAGGLTSDGNVLPMRIYHATQLEGPWREHPQSPIATTDIKSARPSGAIVAFDDRLYRFAQDGEPTYGSRVRGFEITDLTPGTYQEREVEGSPLLEAGPAHWQSGGMHHMDAHEIESDRWVACVDGWFST